MKCSEVKTAIVETIEAIEPNDVVYSGDVFKHVTFGSDVLGYDRQFQIQREQPQGYSRVALGSADSLEVVFSANVVYINTGAENFETRILDDGDSIVLALKKLEQNYDQIYTADTSGSSDLVADENGNRVCSWSLTIRYDPRS